MRLINSSMLGVLLLFLPVLAVVAYIILKKRNAETITLGLLVILMLMPLPELFWTERILQSVGFLDYDQLVELMYAGLPKLAVLSNIFLLLSASTMAAVLVLSSAKPRAVMKLSALSTLYLLICLLRVDLSIGTLLMMLLSAVLLLFGEFKSWMIRPLFLVSYTIYCMVSLLGVYFDPGACIDLDGKWNGIMLNVNSFTTPLGFTLILLMLMHSFKLSSRREELFYLLTLTLLVVMVRSRAAVICYAALLFFYVMLRSRATPIWLFFGMGAMCIAVVMWPEEDNMDFSSITSLRWDMWEFSLDAIQKHPLIGNGGSFFLWDNRLEFPLKLRHMGTAFSTFIQMAVCFGIFGFGLLIAFYIFLFKRLKACSSRVMMLFFILFFLPCTVETAFWPLQRNPSNICYLISLLIVLRLPDMAQTESKIESKAEETT